MSIGRIAIIPGCAHCPHKAFDNTMGIIQREDGSWTEHSSEICFCGYYLGKKTTRNDNRYHIRIEQFLPDPSGIIDVTHPDFGKQMPDNCPLPFGEIDDEY